MYFGTAGIYPFFLEITFFRLDMKSIPFWGENLITCPTNFEIVPPILYWSVADIENIATTAFENGSSTPIALRGLWVPPQ